MKTFTRWSLALIVAGAMLSAGTAFARGRGCCCGGGGYSGYSYAPAAAAPIAAAPAQGYRTYSYEPGTTAAPVYSNYWGLENYNSHSYSSAANKTLGRVN